MRFAMTARTLAHVRRMDDERERLGKGPPLGLNEITTMNVRKVTRYRPGGEDALEELVRRFERMEVASTNDRR